MSSTYPGLRGDPRFACLLADYDRVSELLGDAQLDLRTTSAEVERLAAIVKACASTCKYAQAEESRRLDEQIAREDRDRWDRDHAALAGLVTELHDVLVECGDVAHAAGCSYSSEGCDAELCGLDGLIKRAEAVGAGA